MSAGEKEVRELFGLDESGAGANAKAAVATPDAQAAPSSISSSTSSDAGSSSVGSAAHVSPQKMNAADMSASHANGSAANVGQTGPAHGNGAVDMHHAQAGHGNVTEVGQMRGPGDLAASGGAQAGGPKAVGEGAGAGALGGPGQAQGGGASGGAVGQTGAVGGASHANGQGQVGAVAGGASQANGGQAGAAAGGASNGHGQVGAATGGAAVAQQGAGGAGAGAGAGQGGIGQGAAGGSQVGHAGHGLGHGAQSNGVGAAGGAGQSGVGSSVGGAGQSGVGSSVGGASQSSFGQAGGATQLSPGGVGQAGAGQQGVGQVGAGQAGVAGQAGGAGQTGGAGQAIGAGQGGAGQTGAGQVGQVGQAGAGQVAPTGGAAANGVGAGAGGVGQAGGNIGSAAGQGAGVGVAQGANEGAAASGGAGAVSSGVGATGASGVGATGASGVGATGASGVGATGASPGGVTATQGGLSSGGVSAGGTATPGAVGGNPGGVSAVPGANAGGVSAQQGAAGASGLGNGAGGNVPGGAPGGQTQFSGGGSSIPGGGIGSGGSGVGQAGSGVGQAGSGVASMGGSTMSAAAEESAKKSLFDELITRFPPKEVLRIVQEKDAKGLRQLLVNQLPENMRPELINDVLDMAQDHFEKKAEQALKKQADAKAAGAAGLMEALLHDDLKLTVASGDKLDVREFSVREALSTLFEVRLYALSRNADVKFDDVIGKEASFELRCDKLDDSKNRYWNGICSRIEQVGVDTENLSGYEVVLVPKLWKLSQRKNYRIFQYLSEPAIVKQLLDEWKIEQEWRIDWGQYKARKYRVQYDESDLAFISRNLEDAGITYFFEQIDDKTVMVLEEAPHLTKKREPAIDYQNRAMKVTEQEFVTDVQIGSRTRPGKYTIFDHDYRRAGDFTLAASSSGGLPEEAPLERFHYLPGAFLFVTEGGDTPNADDRGVARHDQSEADKLAKRRFEAKRAAADSLTFQTNVHALRPGVVMEIANHARADLQGTPLLVAAAKLDGALEGGWRHVCEVRNAKLAYRPPLVTPKPRVIGPESATVVGPPGEEIHTDEFGRVRVQFHWDREGRRDANSSCWIHVNQPWAGTGFGGVNIPRIGQEVIVDFLSGDPDRPIIMGRYFTNTTKVPWKLPDNKTQGGFKSMSSPGGGGFNELMFEDKKGGELVRFQAEKDFSGLVKNNYAINIQNNRRIHTKMDDTESVGQDQTIQIGRDRTVRVKQDQFHQVTRHVGLHSITGVLKLQAQEAVLIQSLKPNGIQLICGQSSITLSPDQIIIESPMVHINPGAVITPPAAPPTLPDMPAAPAGHFFGSP